MPGSLEKTAYNRLHFSKTQVTVAESGQMARRSLPPRHMPPLAVVGMSKFKVSTESELSQPDRCSSDADPDLSPPLSGRYDTCFCSKTSKLLFVDHIAATVGVRAGLINVLILRLGSNLRAPLRNLEAASRKLATASRHISFLGGLAEKSMNRARICYLGLSNQTKISTSPHHPMPVVSEVRT
jgi:hypothetical protein